MSKEEILAAQKSLLEQLGSTHLNALKKFKSNFGKKQSSSDKKSNASTQENSTELMYDEEEKHDFGHMEEDPDADKSAKPVLQTGEVSEAIHKAAAEMEA